jgi:hypothetical protein
VAFVSLPGGDNTWLALDVVKGLSKRKPEPAFGGGNEGIALARSSGTSSGVGRGEGGGFDNIGSSLTSLNPPRGAGIASWGVVGRLGVASRFSCCGCCEGGDGDLSRDFLSASGSGNASFVFSGGFGVNVVGIGVCGNLETKRGASPGFPIRDLSEVV